MVTKAPLQINFDKTEIRPLLSKSLSTTLGADVEVNDFEMEILSHVLGKSALVKIYGIDARTTVNLPPALIYKKYRGDKVQTGSGKQKIYIREEHKTEKMMLNIAEKLSCQIGNSVVKVYPRGYSLGVPECNQSLSLFREYIPGPTLTELANQEVDIKWDQIKGALASIALLHASTPLINQYLYCNHGHEMISEKLPLDMGRDYARNIRKIVKSKGESLPNPIFDKLEELFTDLVQEILYNKQPHTGIEGFTGIINGDLDIYTSQLTTTRLLDSGSTIIAPYVCDLAVFLDPSFHTMPFPYQINCVRKEYSEIRGEMENILKLNPVKIPEEGEFAVALQCAGVRGAVRRASSIINYISCYAQDPTNPESQNRKIWINNRVNEYLALEKTLLDTLKHESISKEIVAKLTNKLECIKLFEPYEIKNGGINVPLEVILEDV